MTVRTPTFLKGRFETGDIPLQTDYEDVFDSFIPVGASGTYSLDLDLTVNKVSAQRISGSAATFNTLTVVNAVSAADIYANNAFITSLRATNADFTGTVSAGSIIGNSLNYRTVLCSVMQVNATANFSGLINGGVVSAQRVISSAFSGVTGTFSGVVSAATLNAAAVQGATGVFSGIVSALTVNAPTHQGATATFSGIVSAASVYADEVFVTSVKAARGVFSGVVSAATINAAAVQCATGTFSGMVSAATMNTGSISFGQDALNYFDEGTFVPLVQGSGVAGTSAVYTQQFGKYSRIGNSVFFNIYIDYTGLTGATGNYYITGLPFTAANDGAFSNVAVSFIKTLTVPVQALPSGVIPPNTSRIEMYATSAAGGSSALLAVDLANGLILGGMYQI